MASCFFLLKQFDDVLIYLNSIKSFYENDDDFNWNFAITCAATGDYNEAEQAFTKVKSERYYHIIILSYYYIIILSYYHIIFILSYYIYIIILYYY